MIVESIQNLITYLPPLSHCKILEFVSKAERNECKIGEWCIFDNKSKAICLRGGNNTEMIFEEHRKHKDIHIVIHGEDSIYFGSREIAVPINEYDDTLDYALFNTSVLASVNLSSGSFVLINVNEIHVSSLKDKNSIKVVVKLKV